jgi:hypothetical protein
VAAERLNESAAERDARDTELAARKVTDELLAGVRAEAARQAALLAAKAELADDLQAAVDEYGDRAAKLDELLGTGRAGELSGGPAATPLQRQDVAAIAPAEAKAEALDEPLWGAAAVKVRDELAALPATVRTGPADQGAEVIRLDTTSGGIDPAKDGADRSGGANLRAAQPKHTDEELMEAGRRIMKKLDPPRTQNRFFAAMRAEGFKGSRDRLTAVHKAVKAELEAEEARQDEQGAA